MFRPVRFFDQLKTVLPLAIYLALFQILILRTHIADAGAITAGLIAVIIGLMFFMEGLKLGLMPFGETIGSALPAKSPLPVVFVVANDQRDHIFEKYRPLCHHKRKVAVATVGERDTECGCRSR